LRKIHPGLIIGSRFRADENGKRHFDSNNKLMGDYEQGWERKLPATYEQLGGRDWDCVMTIPPNQWGYNSDWKSSYVKTASDLSQMLMQAVSFNGNLVINFGPDGKGNIRPEEGNIAQQLGQWVRQTREAIYGVRYAGLPKPEYGYYTKKGQQLFLTVFNQPVNKVLRLAIPRDYADEPKQVSVGGKSLSIKRIDMGMSGDKNIYYDVTLPDNFNATQPFVITIDMEKSNKKQSNFGDAKT
jgi:alpha-L-fucosidase